MRFPVVSIQQLHKTSDMFTKCTTRVTECTLTRPTLTAVLTYPRMGSLQFCGSSGGGRGWGGGWRGEKTVI